MEIKKEVVFRVVTSVGVKRGLTPSMEKIAFQKQGVFGLGGIFHQGKFAELLANEVLYAHFDGKFIIDSLLGQEIQLKPCSYCIST